jgi:Mor family transcriptional regulator
MNDQGFHDHDGYPELLLDLLGKIADLLQEEGIAPEASEAIAFAVTEHIRHEWAGRTGCLFTKKKAREKDNRGNLFGEPTECSTPDDDRLAPIIGIVAHGCGDRALGLKVAALIETDWAGEKIYIPKGSEYDNMRRNLEIWRKWDGTAACKYRLCREYGLTEVAFYLCIRAARKLWRGKSQPPLPFIGNE